MSIDHPLLLYFLWLEKAVVQTKCIKKTALGTFSGVLTENAQTLVSTQVEHAHFINRAKTNKKTQNTHTLDPTYPKKPFGMNKIHQKIILQQFLQDPTGFYILSALGPPASSSVASARLRAVALSRLPRKMSSPSASPLPLAVGWCAMVRF